MLPETHPVPNPHFYQFHFLRIKSPLHVKPALGRDQGLLLSVVYMLLIWIFSDGMVWIENAERIKSTWLNAPRLLAIPIALHGWSFILSMIAACGKSIQDPNAEITWWTPETVCVGRALG
ncbi:hypothetical protein A0H81_10453 [Grifola frondosa]|uniref:Uncharacterized protein n=1 Tax=Grifola frondosa TaxID=5627 RepID=A0A1C7LY85_GRIFR|nr:hypothetical protein A0H81_10453 [Grifola frondosa]